MREPSHRKLRVLDCEEGRRLGCGTYCCKLIVRYDPDQVVYGEDGVTRKSCVDKDPSDGYCVHLDRATHRCAIWSTRPRVCREYSCNDDSLLQVAIRTGARSIVDLVLGDSGARTERRVVVPEMDDIPEDG